MSVFEQKIVEGVALIASKISEPESFNTPLLAKHYLLAVREVGLRLRTGEPIYCVLCGRGPFTRKGYYLHLKRIHSEDILDLVKAEAQRISSSQKI